MKHLDWHNLSINKIYSELQSSPSGLSSTEALVRLEKYGKNALPKSKHDSFLKIFFRQLLEPMEILLLIAMAVSFLIGETIDGFAILFIIFVDIIMGSIQEWKAGRTAESLASLIRVETTVIRDNKEQKIDSSGLTIGDIILLSSGDKISADARIIECKNLQVDESILTGESMAASKTAHEISQNAPLAERRNMVYAGTNVVTGRAKAIVIAIGIDTEVGKIADTVTKSQDEKSPLTIRMEKFTKQISIFVVIIAILVASILLIKGTSGSDILLSVIALAVAAMPEGLGLALTMALTIASNRMSKQNVIVKRLNAVESLGSCTVIASDKTGTLTINEQTARRIVLPDDTSYSITGTGYNNNGEVIAEGNANLKSATIIAKMGALNNEAKLEKHGATFIPSGDSIDVAFLALSMKLNVKTTDSKIINRIPYESENQYSAVTFLENNKKCTTIKGSLEVVLARCADMQISTGKTVPLDRHKINRQNETLAREGYRVIALAVGNGENPENLHFLGLVAFIDPVREEVGASISECRTAGIKVLMITGDHPLTAFSIAKDLGLADSYNEVTTGSEVNQEYNKGDKSFDKFIATKRVFTRVTPLDKLHIVEALKRRGEFVAVTGDGVNDAPALKSANIGIAMGSGTDVAKETADLIILDDNFKSIVAGVKEGRNAYSNIRKVSFMLLGCGIGEVLFFCLAIASNMPIPLVAIQLLWLNLVTDGLQDFALSFEKAEDNIMSEPPRPPKESIFNKELLTEVLVSGISIGLITFVVWVFLVNVVHMEIPTARGYIMTLMVFIQNMHVLNARSERISVFKTPISRNLWVLFAILSAIILQFIVSEVPFLSSFLQTTSIPLVNILILFLISTLIILVSEIYKLIKRQRAT